MNPKSRFDKEQVRTASAGRWPEILSAVGGIPIEILDGKHHPCCKCGGTDRFRTFTDDSGGVICNQCFNKNNSDGFATIMWMLGCTFPEAVEKIADYLGVKSNRKKSAKSDPAAHPAKDLEFMPWSSPMAKYFVVAKPGVTEESLLAQGCQMARYKRSHTVIVWPIIGNTLDVEKPVGYVIMDYKARPLPKYDRSGNIVGQTDKKITYGSKPGLVGVHGIERLKTDGLVDAVWKAEGITDAAALWSAIPENLRDRHVVITNANGASETPKWPADFLSNFNTNLLHDCDIPGQAGAKEWGKFIASKIAEGKTVRNVVLPYDIEGKKGKDIRDWLTEGNSYADLLNLADQAEPIVVARKANDEVDEGQVEHTGLPEVELPKGEQTISDAGRELGGYLSVKKTHFTRGNTVVRVGLNDHNQAVLVPIEPERLASDFEQVARLVKVSATEDGETRKPTICRQADAKLILVSEAFQNQLPQLRLFSRSPVIVEHNHELIVVVGYQEGTGILAQGTPPPTMTLLKAIEQLKGLLVDFRFASRSDRSRALAALITPGLLFGGLLPGRAPVDLGEADQSQTGKGFRNKLTAAIYGYSPTAISQQKRGVGSLEESFDRALVAGQIFISIDNVRGQLDSPKIESFLTEDTYYARCAYTPNTEIDPRRVYVMFTSNKADITTDFANRSSCVRLLKQPDGYVFRIYPEGDLLDHVRANQSTYLGAVFTIITEWFRRGKCRTKETRHDFRPWAQTMDWIVQEVLGEAPLLDGHLETQRRMTTPTMNWLRDVSLAVVRQTLYGRWMIATEILDVIAEDSNIDIPGLKSGDSVLGSDCRKNALQQMGRRLKQCFRDMDSFELDGILVEREEGKDAESRPSHRYRFTPQPSLELPPDKSTITSTQPEANTELSVDSTQLRTVPLDNSPDGPLINPLTNPRKPADPPNGFSKSHTRQSGAVSVTCLNGDTNGTVSGSGEFKGPNDEYEEVVFE